MFVDGAAVFLSHAVLLEFFEELLGAEDAGLVAFVEVVHIPLQGFGAAVVFGFLAEEVAYGAGGVGYGSRQFAGFEFAALAGKQSGSFFFLRARRQLNPIFRFGIADDFSQVASAKERRLLFARFAASERKRFGRLWFRLLELLDLRLVDEGFLFFAAASGAEDAHHGLIAAEDVELLSGRFDAEAS
jgi:hypothetical protein